MYLTDAEKRMLDGRSGRLVQAALENIVRYAGILGAGDLCEVTRATVFCGAHNYLSVLASEDADEVFSKMNLATDEIIPFDRTCAGCHVQSDVGPCDPYAYAPFGQTEAFFRKNARFLEQARRAGVTIAGTCAPYLTGWLPVKGEHFVTTESGVTVIGNAIWGAMANSDGIEAAFWSAICGRTPRWGNHLPDNRGGTHAFRVNVKLRDIFDWDALGMAVGTRLPGGAVPVVYGDFAGATFNKLRQFCTSLAGTAPLDWLITRIDSSSGVACAVMKIPAVVDFEADQDPCRIITTGDRVRMNGATGEVEILAASGICSEPQLNA